MGTPSPGTVRYRRDGQWVVVDPHTPLYSTATMVAEEVWTGERWEPLEGEER